MTPPFSSFSSAASGPDGRGDVTCAVCCDASYWAPHHVRLNGDFRCLCSSCVLLLHPEGFCTACLLLLYPDDDTTACSRCGAFFAHLSCILDPTSFVCTPCAAAAARRPPFSYNLAGGGHGMMDERSARVLFAAAWLAHLSALRDAAAAREVAERSVWQAVAARKRAREMLDAAFRAAEEESRNAKNPVTPVAAIRAAEAKPRRAKSPATPAAAMRAAEAKHRSAKSPATPAAADQPKKNTSKSSEANRDTLLKFNSMQQPALASIADAAAAACSMSPSIDDKRSLKRKARGSVDRTTKDDRKVLFGELQY